MSIRCAIVDDESLAREGLRILLEKNHAPDVEIIGQAACARDAIGLLKARKPDLLFLDINMPEQSGLDLIKEIDPSNMPFVVLVTAYAEFAVQGFESAAVDYLLKPVSEKRLAECMRRVRLRIAEKDAAGRNRALKLMLNSDSKAGVDAVKQLLFDDSRPSRVHLLVSDGGRRTRVDIHDIVCVQAAGDHMCISTVKGDYVHRSTLKKLFETLTPDRFFRIHRSIIVNVDYVREIVSLGASRYRLTLANSIVVQSSRIYRHAIQKMSELLGH